MVATHAVSYGTMYKGAGRHGYVYSSGRHNHVATASVGATHAPVATMGSTSIYRGSVSGSASETMMSVHTLTTAASAVYGGVTTMDTYSPGGPRKVGGSGVPPGACTECNWVEDGDGGYVCSVCGAKLDNGCDCGGYCGCPIDLDSAALLFMALMAAVYTLLVVRGRAARATE